MNVTNLAAAAIVLAATTLTASASTITFSGGTASGDTYTESGFVFADLAATMGQCGPDAPCMMLNGVHTTTMTAPLPGSSPTVLLPFSVVSFGLDFQGEGGGTDNSFQITAYFENGSTNTYSFFEDVYPQHDYHTFVTTDLVGLTSLAFIGFDNANVRIDNIVAEIDDSDYNVPDVPLPATGLLLAGAVGAVSALRRRRKAQA